MRRSEKGPDSYPLPSILLAVLMLYLTPFTTSFLAIPATLICLYRVIRYDARVYATDYCIIAPIIVLSRAIGGVPLLLYLSLFAAIWYFLRRGFRADMSYIVLLILANYLILRMQMQINSFALSFGQMFVLCILLPEQDEISAERSMKAFCMNLLISSSYAWVFRNHYYIRNITGAEALAIWGTDIKRFKGLFADPNYFMTYLTVAMALVLKLKDANRISNRYFVIMLTVMTMFGILTYSKTYFLMFILLVLIYVAWQYWNKRLLRGLLLTIVSMFALVVIFRMENSPFEVVLTRFRSAKNISDLTTNRSDLYLLYLREISSNTATLLFGKGFSASNLGFDPHNLYLEITYYSGLTGLILTVSFYIGLVLCVKKKLQNMSRENIVSRYEVLLVVFTLFFTLHGFFGTTFYVGLFLAYLAMLLPTKGKEKLAHLS